MPCKLHEGFYFKFEVGPRPFQLPSMVGMESVVGSPERIELFFFLKTYLFFYVYSILSTCMPARQKRTPNLITDGCEPPCGCWELDSGPLEEQPVLLTSEQSLQLPVCFLSLGFSE